MKIRKKSISSFLNNDFRDYAIYTITSRGIPNFYDSLTPVQRLILMEAPKNFNKTLSLVGDVIKTGIYHHGDLSLQSAINRITKTFENSINFLDGDGFFGSPLQPSAAASRYTSIRINESISKIIDTYKYLNRIEPDATLGALNIKIPIGLGTTILGISVGYQTKILPRKIEEIEKYLNGKPADLTPHFQNFNGKILKNEDGSWILEGEYKINEKNKTIEILNIPPLMKFKTFIKKVEKIIDRDPKIVFNNFSNDKIYVKFEIKNNFDEFKELILNSIRLKFTENIVFTADNRVVTYDKIEDYLDDFKIRNIEIDKKDFNWNIEKLKLDIDYNSAAVKFFTFMLEKEHTYKEVDNFLKNNFNEKIIEKLERISLKKLNKDEKENIIKLIEKLKRELESFNNKLLNLNKNYSDLKQTFKISKSKNNLDLIKLDSDIEEFILNDDGVEKEEFEED